MTHTQDSQYTQKKQRLEEFLKRTFPVSSQFMTVDYFEEDCTLIVITYLHSTGIGGADGESFYIELNYSAHSDEQTIVRPGVLAKAHVPNVLNGKGIRAFAQATRTIDELISTFRRMNITKYMLRK